VFPPQPTLRRHNEAGPPRGLGLAQPIPRPVILEHRRQGQLSVPPGAPRKTTRSLVKKYRSYSRLGHGSDGGTDDVFGALGPGVFPLGGFNGRPPPGRFGGTTA
jgi:hypothetical protein